MNPFNVGDTVVIRGGPKVQRFGVQGTVIRLLGDDRVEIDLGPDPMWKEQPDRISDTVKVIHPVGEVELV